MGGGSSRALPARPAVAEGKTRICVAGFTLSHHTHRARKLADALVAANPQEYESWFYFDKAEAYRELLTKIKAELPKEQQELHATHKSSPFCWLETSKGIDAKGGRDRLCEWALTASKDEKVIELASTPPSLTELYVDETPGTAPTS